jgi:hypothetical protein
MESFRAGPAAAVTRRRDLSRIVDCRGPLTLRVSSTELQNGARLAGAQLTGWGRSQAAFWLLSHERRDLSPREPAPCPQAG